MSTGKFKAVILDCAYITADVAPNCPSMKLTDEVNRSNRSMPSAKHANKTKNKTKRAEIKFRGSQPGNTLFHSYLLKSSQTIGDEKQPCQSPTLTDNVSSFVPIIRALILVILVPSWLGCVNHRTP